ncbi:MAG TPA: glycosyltransferase family 4 protein [Polyangia bacterium]|nr:glycosyltransferase family 4 protein [Polyangia bacterium]
MGSGVTRWALARGLSRKDIETALAVMGPPLSADERSHARAIPGLALHERPAKLEWMDAPWDEVDAAGQWLLELEAERPVDVVHLNSYAHGVLPFSAPKLVVGHSCVFSWWWAVNGGAPAAEWLTYQRRTAAGLHGADLVVAPTRWMLQTLRRHYGALPSALVIGNGREPGDFPVGNKDPFVLGAGRLWDDAQNLKTLARVASNLQWPVLLAGDARRPSLTDSAGEPTDGARDARPASLTGARLLGRLSASEMAETYGRASIYALPARYEPFGLSVLEAALAGCPLVLGDIPSLRETWHDAAIFVPPDDEDALSGALRMLIRNGASRRAMAARARHRALRFTARRMVDGYLAAYEQLLTRAPQFEAAAAIASVVDG